MYSAGLESLLGEEVDESEKDIEATAGLRLDLLGVSLRPVAFFTGQSGLMSALWNAPTELTPALQVSIKLNIKTQRPFVNFKSAHFACNSKRPVEVLYALVGTTASVAFRLQCKVYSQWLNYEDGPS